MREQIGEPSKRERNWDAYGAVIASFIGLLALLVSAYTAHVQSKQVRAQVWPRVEVGRWGGAHSFVASNNGVGPARVKAVRVTLDGRPVKRWRDILRAMNYDHGFTQAQISGRVMPPGAEIHMFTSPGDEPGLAMFQKFTSWLFHDKPEHKIGVLICYCSVFDECWLASMGHQGGVTIDEDQEIKRCPIKDDERFRE